MKELTHSFDIKDDGNSEICEVQRYLIGQKSHLFVREMRTRCSCIDSNFQFCQRQRDLA